MIDEQASHEAFEQSVGGPDRAFRLLRLYISATQATSGNRNVMPSIRTPLSKEELLRQMAKRDGYTNRQIDMFLALQSQGV